MNLKDKVAIITGASGGIGSATARNLNEAGMKLVITGRRREQLSKLAADLNHVELVAGDIIDPKMPQRLIDKALDSFGRCDVVFNNAGIMEPSGVEKIDIDRVRHMVRTNVEAMYAVAYAAVNHFRLVNRGHLVNVSSLLGTKVRPGTGAYAGTKHTIEALSESLRIELAQTGVKVSCIEPGIVDTDLCAHFEVHPKQVFNIKNALQPEDVARAVRFMLEQPEHVLIPRLMILPAEQAA